MGEQTTEVHRIRWERDWTRQDRAISTFRSYWAEVERYLRWCEGQRYPTSSLDPADLYLAHVERSSTRHMARFAARAIKAYGKFLADLYEEPSPFAKLKLPPEPSPLKAPTATSDDLDRLLAACAPPTSWGRCSTTCEEKAIIPTLARTGMRRGEVAAMTLDDLDLVNQTLRIPKTKTTVPRVVHLPDDVVAALLRYLRATDDLRPEGQRAVWLGNNGQQRLRPLTSNGIGHMLYRRGKAAAVDVSAHSFSRMYAGQWMAKGSLRSV